MRRFNRVAVAVIIAATFAAFLAVPATRWTILGCLRREPFYEGRPVSYWRSQLAANLEAVRQGSMPDEPARAFKGLGSRGVPALIAALKDDDPSVRARAAQVLGKLGRQAADAAPAVADAANDPDAQVRRQAVTAVSRVNAQAAVSVLAQAVHDPDAETCERAIRALGDIGPPAAAAIPALKEALQVPDPNRIRAALALWRIDHRAAEVMPTLIGGLLDPDWVIRGLTLTGVEELGSKARACIPALIEVRKNDGTNGGHAWQILVSLAPDWQAMVNRWPTFTSKKGGFSIRLPDKPEKDQEAMSVAGSARPVTRVRFEACLWPISYSVGYYSGWPVKVPPGATAEQGLDALVAERKTDGKVVKETRIRLGGKYAGRELVILRSRYESILWRERYYWVKGRLYELTARAAGELTSGPEGGEVERFLDSFRLLDE